MKRNSVQLAFKAAHDSIASIENLAKALSVSTSDFENLWDIPEDDRYTKKLIPKASGGYREVYNPCRELRLIQRRINTRIFSNPHVVKWPNYLYGSIPSSADLSDEYHSRDYVSCAKQHCQAKSILKLDIKDFFDNVHDDLVEDVFKSALKYPEDVSLILTRVCTYNFRLVQGALTSSYIAMMCLGKLEQDVVARLRKKQLIYTRFVDDITVSSKISSYDFTYAIRIIEQMLTDKGLQLNQRKTIVQHASSSPLTVHGLRICFSEPRLPSDEVRRIRSSVQALEVVARESNYRQTFPYRKDFNRCMGRVNKLSRVKHSQHKKLIRRLQNILPLPSKREVDYVKSAADKLATIYEEKHDSFWYKKFYYRLNDRLIIVQRSYPNLAKKLRLLLKEKKPTHE